MADPRPFRATVRQAYALSDRHLLILESYEGDIGSGDRLRVTNEGGGSTEILVRDLAWGSAFSADRPPLTLVVDPIEGEAPESGATIEPAD